MLEEKDFKNQEEVMDVPDHHWKSCCHYIDRRILLFWAQLVISFIVLFFCWFEFLSAKSCEEQAPFLAILSSILSVWLPTPLY